MKKTSNIKTRIIAGLLSTITAFSVGAIAISSASAEDDEAGVTDKGRGFQRR